MNDKMTKYFEKAIVLNHIDNDLYTKHKVKKGLRNEDHTGVLVALTRISDVVGYEKTEDSVKAIEGKLYYRGYDVEDIIEKGVGGRYLFEEVCFLLLFGYLPNRDELKEFKKDLASRYELPVHFLESKILALPNLNVMNKLQQEVLMLHAFDEHDPDDVSVKATLDKGLDLIARIPFISIFSYNSKAHYYNNESLFIHPIDENLSIAESILYMLRPSKKFSQKEAELLDACLVLHADHGGGNNSTFTNVVISSTGTDIYSTFAGSIGSLKGPRHGGANLAVKRQMKEIINTVGLEPTDQQLSDIVDAILDRRFNDNKGLVYGIGHAVYTLSDPRARVLKKKCKEIAIEKGREKEFELYARFEEIAIKRVYEKKHKISCANVDFYSGLVYTMLDIPDELFPLLFVMGRSVGWVAHNVENKLYCDKIIRPAGKYVGETLDYIDMDNR